jgi:predicted  nucleic acid-binding Zn-ribbon protein
MSAALGLLRLQQVDSRIDQLEDKLGRIMAELENDAEASAARQALEAAEGELESAEAGRLAAESQTTSQRLKLRKAESSLYGGSVRNPKELQDLQADVASLKKHLASLEESELCWMEKLEAAEARSREARERLAQVSSRLKSPTPNLPANRGTCSMREKTCRQSALPPWAPSQGHFWRPTRPCANPGGISPWPRSATTPAVHVALC